MINKYSIDLRQFNHGESDIITFPTFTQCLLYGIHKLRGAFGAGTSITQAILIGDSHGRKIVVSPTKEELGSTPPIHKTQTYKGDKLIIKRDPHDGDATFLF